MKNSDIKKQTGLWASLIGEPTPAKVSGLTFTLASVGIIVMSFLWTIILMICGVTQQEGYAQADWYLYMSFVLTPVVFAIVAGGILYWTKTPLKRAWEGQLCPPKYYLIAVLLQVGLFSLSQINNLFLEFLGNFGYQQTPIQIPSMEGVGFISVLFVIGVLPAIFEEILFRGFLLKGLRSFGEVGAVLLCGGLFALFHQNPAQTLYQFCCGVAFAYVALKSGSILPTILSHFINNAIILTLTKFGISTFDPLVGWIVFGVSILCLIASMVCLFMDKQPKKEELSKEEKQAERVLFFKSSAVGIVICALIWLMTLFVGM